MSGKNLQLFESDEEDRKSNLSKTALRTKNALDKIVTQKLHNNKVTTLSNKSTNNDVSYIRYKSSQITDLSHGNVNNTPRERIIKISDEKIDPMLPNSFRIRKTPSGPETDHIVPVMHDESNTEKITKADQKKWEISPFASNWKNTKGFIIGIENRLQNSTSLNKLTETEIEKSTKKFTALSDALKNAEQKAKSDLKARANWRKQQEHNKMLDTKQRLEKLAEEARNSRKNDQMGDNVKDKDINIELSEKLQRRAERRRRAEEELRSGKISTKQKVRKLAKEQGREVSERVVLGVSEALKKKQKEGIYDSELYIRSKPPSTTKGTNDQLYDEPLFSQEHALQDIYRSRKISGYTGLGGKKDTEDDSSSTVVFVKDSEQQERS